MSKCIADKAAIVVLMKLAVLANLAQGGKDGYDAEVVFVFNCMPTAWPAALPEETKEALAESEELKGFPGIPTTKLNNDPDLACLLQVASYNMLQALPAITSMLAKNVDHFKVKGGVCESIVACLVMGA